MEKRILIIDDDENLLKGLTRILKGKMKDWEIVSVSSPDAALKELESSPCYAVLSDQNMPGMNGTELLQQVANRYPRVLRLLFSGQVDLNLPGHPFQIADQLLQKPCGVDQIIEGVQRAAQLRLRAEINQEKRHLASLNLSSDLTEVVQEVFAGCGSDEEFHVGLVVMTAKGDPTFADRIESCCAVLGYASQEGIEAKVKELGYSISVALLLVYRLETGWVLHACPNFSLMRLWESSVEVASAAAALAEKGGCCQKLVKKTFASGLLHDIGRLLLAVGKPEEYEDVLALVKMGRMSLETAENQRFSVGMERIGCWILKKGGCEKVIYKAVGAQVHPSYYDDEGGELVSFLHAACALHYALKEKEGKQRNNLDIKYLKQKGVLEKILKWSESLGLFEKQDNLVEKEKQATSRVLIVEDDDNLRKGIVRNFKKEKIDFLEAVDGWEALELLQKESVDLILSDVKMSKMNGYQFLKALKDDPDLAHIPVIMLSGLNDVEKVVMCMDAGAEDYLQKPVDHTLLMNRIRCCLERSRLHVSEQNKLLLLEKEKQRVEELLRVLFPQPVIQELKREKAVRPRRHERVCVLFADIVGFTTFCRTEKPEVVFLHLQQVMDAMEQAAARNGMQKIKTIGDAFLCVGGLWQEESYSVMNAIKCALEMIRVTPTLPSAWQVRVGIHVGPVISGVVGCRQYQFDVWGDTVNVSARIQELGEAGAIAISDQAYEEVATIYPSVGSRCINLKGRGEMKLHMIRGAATAKNK